MKNYLVFDIGASNGRALVAQVEDNKFNFVEVHRFENGPICLGEDLYWDILNLFAQVKKGILKALAEFGSVESMAIDTWGCDFGLLDKDGRLIGNVAMYRDVHRYAHAKYLHRQVSENELFKMSGGPTDRIMGIYNLYSLKYRNATEYKAGKRLLMIPDLLNYFLTGKIANEFTNATMTLMCNQYTRQWEHDIFDEFGFEEELFTPLIEAGTVLGNISDSVCQELGIEPIPVIVPATHDTASAVAGMPVVTDKTWAFMSLGTWCISGMETDEPVIFDEVIEKGFGNEGGVEGKNMLIKNTTGLWIIQKCREYWVKEANADVAWNDIVDQLLSADEISAYINVDDERFGMDQPNMPKTIQEYCGETNQQVPEGLGQIAKVVYQSLVLKLKMSIMEMQDLTGKEIHDLHLVGGGTKAKFLCQWISSAVGINISAGPTETTSVGNLIFQLIADGVINSVQDGRLLCHNSYEKDYYSPDNTEEWEVKYQVFKDIIKGKVQELTV